MLTAAFSFSLDNPIQEQKAIIARIDGVNPSLICVTVGGKVFIYTPKGVEGMENVDIQFLNLNKQITSLTSGSYNIDQDTQKELLFMASENTLLAYDVTDNQESFYKEISDGISSMCFGDMFGHKNQPMILIGGNCSLLGYDSTNEETYWNVTSDTVSSMCLCDIDSDNQMELVVGCEDNTIRIFKNEEIQVELTEAAIPKCLCQMTKSRFGFGLDNGMVGVYHKKSRKWRAKSQIKPIAMLQASFDKDEGYQPLIIGRVSGQVEIRHDSSGETLHKIVLNEPIAQVLKDDFRGDGSQQIIAITTQGSVKGFTLSAKRETITDQSQTSAKLEMQEQIELLQKKKQNLLMKYQSLQEGVKQNKEINEEELMLPKDTRISHKFNQNAQKGQVELVLYSNQGIFLKSVILFNDKLFDGESFLYCPKKVTNNIVIPLSISSFSQEKIRAKIMVGTSAHSQYYQVFDCETILPKFAPFMWVNNFETVQAQQPIQKLILNINERVPRYMKWIAQSFIIDKQIVDDFEHNQDKKQFIAKFIHIKNNNTLQIQVNSLEGQVIIMADSIELMGDIVQDMSNYMNIQQLESSGEFSLEMEEFRKVLEQTEQFQSTRIHITADIADSVNNVKTFIVKAEDSRMMGDMKFMRKYYSDVIAENKNLTTELLKRQQNNEILMSNLRKINNMINKASNLRVGNFKTKVTNLCRDSIKNKNLHSLIFIIENGKEI